jgi:serine protease Do
VASPRELARHIAGVMPGKDVSITVWRDGKTQDFSVKLGEMPGDKQQASLDQSEPETPGTLDDLGLTVTKADDGKGLVVTDVDPDSDAADRGIQPGDVITQVNSRDVTSVNDVNSAIAAAAKNGRKAVLIQLSRDDTSRFVALPVNQG